MIKVVYAEKQPFKSVENYFTVTILYQEEQEDDSEVDLESDDDSDKVLVELNPLLIGLNDVNIDPNTNNECKWVLNKDIDFKYVLSKYDTTSKIKDMIIKKLNKISVQHILVCSSSINQIIEDVTSAMFLTSYHFWESHP